MVDHYKISGSLSNDAEIGIIDESDYSTLELQGDTASGNFQAGLLTTSGTRTLFARRSDGMVAAYGNVRPVQYYPQMVVDIQSEGTYDNSHVSFPGVIKDGDTYKMWYTGWGSNYRIIYCTSTDGINWSNYQMVVDIGEEGTYDTGHVQKASVIKDGDTYKMWYSGQDSGSTFRILYCTSTNGIEWTNYQMVVDIGDEGTYDTSHAQTPTVIKDGSTYKMWYSGSNLSNYRIIYCTSNDGITWSNHQMVLDKASEGTYDIKHSFQPSVVKDGSIYKMWYSGNNYTNYRIIYCKSSDGITWTDFELSVDLGDEGTYDTNNVYMSTVIKDGASYKMWYSAYNGSNFRIMYL